MKKLKWKFILIGVLIIVGFIFLLPTIQWYSLPKSQRDKIELGVVENTNITFTEDEKQELERLRKIREKTINLGLDLQGGMYIVLQAKSDPKLKETEKYDMVKRALEILRNRIDQFGVSEPSIRPAGSDRIIVELPGVKDPERVTALLNVQGLLEFKLVDDELSKFENFENYQEGILKKDIILPDDKEILFFFEKDENTGRIVKRMPLVVNKEASLTGAYLKTAEVGFGSIEEPGPNVLFSLKPEGGDIFERVTGENLGKRLAIVLDRKIRSFPTIQAKLRTSGVITGNFSPEEARDLALILRAGAFPIELEIIEQRSVGPSLGKDSIDAGIKAGIIGSSLVILFIILYYKLSGIISILALFLNIFLLLGILAPFNFTLTLPGIAGIILTIGMAVDANVIIYERIKEELKLGKTPRLAIASGYQRAFSCILDSNITTLITSFILMQFGTGPIKGFAVTLFVGIAVNLFAAIFVTRVLFDFITSIKPIEKLSI